MRTIALLIVLVVTAGIALAACGSSSPTSTSARANPMLKAARCMRAHGVPRYPDPGHRGGMTVVFTPGSSTPTIDGISFSGPAFLAAEKICKPFGEPRSGSPAVSAEQKRTLLGFASCMRHHGLSQWADPSFPPGGGIMGGGGPYDRNSPALKHATEICNGAMRSSQGSG
jgi:hypothetical protein